MYHGLYSEAVVSSVASAVALAKVGQFREAVQYVQKAAKALYEGARELFERVKVTVQRLVELFVEAVTRVLAWIDEHKAYLFLMAAGVVALSAALNMWGLVELDKLAHAASLAPFAAAGVKEYSREEVFNILKNDPDPYEKFKKIAKVANAGRVKLAEPWESLRVLIMPRSSEKKRLMSGKGAELYSKYRENENYKRALFYATLALEKALDVYRSALRKLEEAFGVYRSALREVVEVSGKATQRVEVGEEPFKRVVYMADLGLLTQLAEEEGKAFEKALEILRKRLNEYAVKYGLRDLLNVDEDAARRLAEAEYKKLPTFKDISFGVKALAALMAYRERELGRKSAYGTAAKHWLEEGGSAWLLYYAPKTAYDRAEKARAEKPTAVEEMVAEALRRLFLKPGADHYRGFVELLGSGKLALMLEDKTKSAYVFRLYRIEEGGGLVDLGIELLISKVGEEERAGITYALIFDMERWLGFFEQELEAATKAAEVIRERLPVEDRLPYMLSWVNSDVAISGGRLVMTTSHLWQLAETHALFDWTYIAVRGVGSTLKGPKPQFYAHTSLKNLDEAIRRSAEGGWLKMLGVETESWDGLKQWVADHWDEVINMVKRRLEGVKASSSFDLAGAWEELKGLKSRLNDDKTAREVVAPALLLIQAERLGVNETTLRYFGAVISGAVGGDGYVSAARKEVDLTSGKRAVALLWAAALAAHGIKTKLEKAGSAFLVVASGDDAVKLARLYFLFGPPLLEGDDRLKSHKLYEAVKLGAEGLDVSWEGLRRTKKGRVAADLTISEGNAAVKYNVYLRGHDILLEFHSTDRSRVELAARLLKLAGVGAEVKRKGGRDEWYIVATTDMLVAGRKELRDALAEIVRRAVKNGWVEASKAEGWLEKLESGRVLKEGWPKYYVGLARSGALMVVFSSTDPDSIEREAQRLKEMGLEEGRHFTVKMPEEGRDGYVYIRREGLERAAKLSVRGEGEQQKLAAEFVEYILQRAGEAGVDVRKKAEEIVKKGKERASLELKGFEREFEVDGKRYKVKVIDGGAEFDVGRSGKKLLRIRITAEVDGTRREYAITFGRYGSNNAAKGFAYVSEETDAERLAAVVEALTGVKPKIRRRSDGTIEIVCGREHLEGFKRFAELTDAIEKWLEETGR
jgi:hypothetical protein